MKGVEGYLCLFQTSEMNEGKDLGMRLCRRIRVVVADDHQLFREGLCLLLKAFPDIEVVGEASNGEEAVLVVRKTKPDVVLLDLEMPVLDGLSVMRVLAKDTAMRTKVLLLSSYENDEYIRDAMRAGATGYVLKRVGGQELVSILKGAVYGNLPLSPFLRNLSIGNNSEKKSLEGLTERERRVLDCLVVGYSNREIAKRTYISPDTVKLHLKNIFSKLKVRNRTQAAIVALQEGAGP